MCCGCCLASSSSKSRHARSPYAFRFRHEDERLLRRTCVRACVAACCVVTEEYKPMRGFHPQSYKQVLQARCLTLCASACVCLSVLVSRELSFCLFHWISVRFSVIIPSLECFIEGVTHNECLYMAVYVCLCLSIAIYLSRSLCLFVCFCFCLSVSLCIELTE